MPSPDWVHVFSEGRAYIAVTDSTAAAKSPFSKDWDVLVLFGVSRLIATVNCDSSASTHFERIFRNIAGDYESALSKPDFA